jgi:hypothetical protein
LYFAKLDLVVFHRLNEREREREREGGREGEREKGREVERGSQIPQNTFSVA